MGNLRVLLDLRCILVNGREYVKREFYRSESTP
jgi:hypothetical protein